MDVKSKKIILFVFLVLVACEIILRFLEPYLSFDLKHYEQVPSIIDSLAQAKNTKILFLGNSLTRRGIDPKLMKASLDNASIKLIYPDDSNVTDWYWIYRNRIEHAIPNLDYLFIVYAPYNLYDPKIYSAIEITRLALFAHATQLGTIISREHLDFDQSFQLLASHFTDLFALRERIQIRVLDMIPHYRYTVQRINVMRKKKGSPGPLKPPQKKIPQKNMDHLKALLRNATSHGTTVVMVAVPLSKKYRIPEDLLGVLSNTPNVYMIDANKMDNIHESDFMDDKYHLNKHGARKLTTFILKEFLNKIKKNQ